jgi:hypothetical protein
MAENLQRSDFEETPLQITLIIAQIKVTSEVHIRALQNETPTVYLPADFLKVLAFL